MTEKARALGAALVNKNGEMFIHPLETRDAVTAAILRECRERHLGVNTADGGGVWLDTPMIDQVRGEGTIERHLPKLLRMLAKFEIDIRKEPILVRPTLHYQNGGLEITPDGMTVGVENLDAAGEVVGGIHGRNRLMGNALLDIIVFGRAAGKNAAERARHTPLGRMTLAHVDRHERALADAGIQTEKCSPLLFPDYTDSKNT